MCNLVNDVWQNVKHGEYLIFSSVSLANVKKFLAQALQQFYSILRKPQTLSEALVVAKNWS